MKSFKNRSVDKDFPVRIYRNLNKKGFILSVKQFGKVVAHTENITLRDCTMHVNEKARLKVVDTGIKNVHAFVEGYIIADISPIPSFSLFYNPYRCKNFYTFGRSQVSNCKILYTQNNCILIQF